MYFHFILTGIRWIFIGRRMFVPEIIPFLTNNKLVRRYGCPDIVKYTFQVNLLYNHQMKLFQRFFRLKKHELIHPEKNVSHFPIADCITLCFMCNH